MAANLFTDTFLTEVGGEFLATKLGNEAVLADVGEQAVADLLTWPDLDEILSTRPLSAPRLRLTQRSADIPVEAYTRSVMSSGEQRRALVPEKVYSQLRDGATLILEAIDRLHPPVRDAVDDLVRMVREAAQANLYLVWGDVGGFGTHWDDHDTFIVQVAGTKRWVVHSPATHPYPMADGADRSHVCPENVAWDGVLSPGQILHVPRGWWHTVRGVGGWSMHLTFGVTRATGMSWMRWLLDQLIDDPAFRQDLPRFATLEERSGHHNRLVERLAMRAATENIDQFLADRDARVPRRQRVCLPWPVAPGELPSTATVEFTPLLPALTSKDQTLTLSTGGRKFTFAAAVRPVLETLIARHRLSVAELAQASQLPAGQLRAMLDVLLRQHLVVIRV
ncbi:MAG: JmjC domain-containing protein [Pseudonocardiaceae bacterium]